MEDPLNIHLYHRIYGNGKFNNNKNKEEIEEKNSFTIFIFHTTVRQVSEFFAYSFIMGTDFEIVIEDTKSFENY